MFIRFCRLLFVFQNYFFSKKKNLLRIIIRVSNSFDPDQVQRFVRPDLGQNCLLKLSADYIEGLNLTIIK